MKKLHVRFFALAAMFAFAVSMAAQKPLYICGAFQNWDVAHCEQFDYADGLYTFDLDLSKGKKFKISTAHGGTWADFDAEALTVAVPLIEGVTTPLFSGIANIEAVSQASGTIRLTVDLQRLTILLGVGEEDDTTDVPAIYIFTANGAPIVSKEEYLEGSYYFDPRGNEGMESLGTPGEPLPLQIRGRGNYTWWGFEKKPYRIKLGAKAPLGGMAKNKHFALLAHADDNNGFLRNTCGFEYSRRIGLEWTPEAVPVELYLNGEYRGLYFLTQTIRVDKEGVDIVEQDDLATTDVDGGWLVEIDNYDTDPHVTVRSGDGFDVYFTYKSPEELSSEQEQFLEAQMTDIDRLIFLKDKQKPLWFDYIDVRSLARFYIVQELTDNYESFHGSCYLFRNRGEQEKWHFGPVWDFGSAFIWDKQHYIYQGREHHQTWIGEMCKFPAFMEIVREEWIAFERAGLTDLDSYIDQFAEYIARAATRDADRWPQYGNRNELQRAEVVKQKLNATVKWLNNAWDTTGISSPTVADADLAISVRDGQLTITSPEERTVTATRLDGTAIQLHLAPGVNTFTLPRGFYVIASRKLLI